ncbi:MAG: 50S ribosomal protein L18 [Bacillota bacterium]
MKSRTDRRGRRRMRVRKKVFGTPERPRVSVFRSSRHVYAQVIDDINGRTLAAASSIDEPVAAGGETGVERARRVGQLLAERARDRGVTEIVFDRSGYKYHGQVKAVAEGAREKGLQF